MASEAFLLGNRKLLEGDYSSAAALYESCLVNGEEHCLLCFHMAIAKEKLNEPIQARMYYEKALPLAADDYERKITLTGCGAFYYKNNMLLKAERLAKRAIDELPGNYEGHHLLALVWGRRERYRDLWEHLDGLKEQFGMHPQYLADRLECMKIQGRYSALLREIDTDPNIMTVIPKVALRLRTSLMLMRDRKEDAAINIDRLFTEYSDRSAAFASLLMAIGSQAFGKAAAIANTILKQEREKPGMLFFLTVYLDIFICYYGCGCKPDERILRLMKKEAALCCQWFSGDEPQMVSLRESLTFIEKLSID